MVAELALALILLMGAGLMAGTFHRFLTLNQGFDPYNVLTVRVSPPSAEYSDPARRLAYYDRALEALLRLPGVSSAGLPHPWDLPSNSPSKAGRNPVQATLCLPSSPFRAAILSRFGFHCQRGAVFRQLTVRKRRAPLC